MKNGETPPEQRRKSYLLFSVKQQRRRGEGSSHCCVKMASLSGSFKADSPIILSSFPLYTNACFLWLWAHFNSPRFFLLSLIPALQKEIIQNRRTTILTLRVLDQCLLAFECFSVVTESTNVRSDLIQTVTFQLTAHALKEHKRILMW